eukprot:1975895-Rhodomonas_salina.1
MDPPTLFQIAGVSFYEELLQNNTISYSRYGYTVFYNAVSEQPRVEAGNAPTKVLFVNLMTTRGPVSSRNSSREIGDPEICLSIAPLAKKCLGAEKFESDSCAASVCAKQLVSNTIHDDKTSTIAEQLESLKQLSGHFEGFVVQPKMTTRLAQYPGT